MQSFKENKGGISQRRIKEGLRKIDGQPITGDYENITKSYEGGEGKEVLFATSDITSIQPWGLG